MTSINTLLRDSYHVRQKLENLEHENASRKTLIHIAVHRLIALRQLSDTDKEPNNKLISSTTVKKEKSGGRSVTPHSEELTSKHITDKNHEYELLLSQLKQQFSTKEKLQESRIEALKEKVEELKSQISKPAATADSFASLLGSTNSRLRGSLQKPNSFTSSLRDSGSLHTKIAPNSFTSSLRDSGSLHTKIAPNSFTSSLRDSGLPPLHTKIAPLSRTSNEEISILSPLRSKRLGLTDGNEENDQNLIPNSKPAKGELFNLGGADHSGLSNVLQNSSRSSPKKDNGKSQSKNRSAGPNAFVKTFDTSSESPSATPGVEFDNKMKKEDSKVKEGNKITDEGKTMENEGTKTTNESVETTKDSISSEKTKTELASDKSNDKQAPEANEEEGKEKDDGELPDDPNAELEAPEANSTSLLHSFANNSDQTSASENDTFTSAQMTLSERAVSGKRERSGSPTNKDLRDSRKKKKRKIQILKSRASKVQVANSSAARSVSGRQISEGMHLEDENINSLNYYHDDNFQDDSFSSPKHLHKKSTTPSADTTSNVSLQPSSKKKKNVFKIT